MAIDALRARADQGDAEAQYNLGVMCHTGRGVPQDDAEAVRWCRLAAEQGVAAAQSTVGVMYGTGRGVPQYYAESMSWYRLAVDQGNARAQLDLGDMYQDGRGVPQDDVQAHMWFNITTSRATGVQRERAVENRDRVEGDLTPDAINEARRFAREWDAAHRR